MEPKSLVLKLVLDELGVDSAIDTVDDRKRVQKAIYIGQLSGTDLGYRFSWYRMGPYCSSLTRDYYSLAEEIAAGDTAYQSKSLRPAVRERLQSLRPLFERPAEFPLSLEDWLELVASYHYLRSVSQQSDEDAKATLRVQKPHICQYAALAEQRLQETGLIG